MSIVRLISPLRLFRLAPAALVLLGLSACAPQTSLWSAAEQPARQNKVEHIRLTHAVSFAAGHSRLEPGEAAGLQEFLQRQKVGYGDQVSLIMSAGSGRLGQAREKALLSRLHRAGVFEIKVAHGAEPAAYRDQATLVVGRYVVVPPACPDWSKPSGSDFTNTVGSNFGCATAVDLGMMVANPGDLVHGEDLGPADGAQSVLGIERYRTGKTIAPGGGVQATPSSPGGGGGASGGMGGGSY